MNKLVILNISRNKMNYFSNNSENIKDKGIVKMHTGVGFHDIEDSDEHTADVYLDMIVHSDKSIYENEEISDKDVDARLKVNFKIVFSYPSDLQEIEDKVILSIIEPYIRKEVMEFCEAIDIPKVPIPYRFWD